MDGQANIRSGGGGAVIDPPRVTQPGGPVWHDQVYRAAAGELV
jgi:hypothetical protein